MISVWPKFRAFDPEMVLHFHFPFKPFPGHAQKRERARERERGRKKEERVEIVQSRARRYRPRTSPTPHRSREAPIAWGFNRDRAKRRSWSREAPTTLIAISPSCRSWSREVSEFDDFFLGFVCVLRNEWYYIFVWQLRKCEQQVENLFSMVFSRTQPNIRKYFSKHFLKCNQTHENIFLPENSISRK